jgi:hypothetical protein
VYLELQTSAFQARNRNFTSCGISFEELVLDYHSFISLLCGLKVNNTLAKLISSFLRLTLQ